MASVADRIYVTRTGEVGSVGVVAVHIDESAADAQAGLAWTYMFAGATKVDGNPHQPLSDRARAAIQADVDELYAELCALVATNRRMSGNAVRGTEAAVYPRRGSCSNGLCRPRRHARSGHRRNGGRPRNVRSRSNQLDHKKEHVHGDERDRTAGTGCKRATAATAQPSPKHRRCLPNRLLLLSLRGTGSCPSAAGGASSPGERADPAERLRAEYAEIAALAAQAARLGVTVDAADAMKKGISADALRRTVLDALAARSEAATVIAAAPSTPVTGDSAIVRRAKERAAATTRG